MTRQSIPILGVRGKVQQLIALVASFLIYADLKEPFTLL